MANLNELYNTNKDFKTYIDKYCHRNGNVISKEEAFRHDLICGKGGIAEMYSAQKAK